MIACATGWVLADSAAPANRSTSSGESATTSCSVSCPVVTVPVLSSTTVSMRRVLSRICGPFTTMPSCAPRPVPTIRAVGVASPRAQGHAMISTATPAVNAAWALPSSVNQSVNVSAARAMTTGTNTADTRSASRCTSARPFCACSTSRASCASWVSAPTRVAVTTSRPPTLSVAPTTGSPGPTSTGTASPVTSAASTAEVPSSITPSVAIFSPGRTTKRWPTASAVIAMRCSLPSCSTVTSLAPRSSRARIAAPAWRFARASAWRPASRNAGTTDATSR